MCWMGAHLLPKTGKENRLPTTATAQRMTGKSQLSVRWYCFIVEILPFSMDVAGKRRMQRSVSPKSFGSPKAAGRSLPGQTGLQRFGRGLLASSHAGTRLPIAANCIQGTGRSPSARRGHAAEIPLSPSFPKAQKNGRHHKRCLPEKADDSTTSYGGIIRIRCKGRRWFLPLSPSSRAPPVFCCEPIIAPCPRPVNRFWGNGAEKSVLARDLGQAGEACLQLLVGGDVVGHLAVVELLVGHHVEVAGAGQAEEDGLFLAGLLAAAGPRRWPPGWRGCSRGRAGCPPPGRTAPPPQRPWSAPRPRASISPSW